MRARGAEDASSYARILARDPEEVAHLLDAISTGVTSFFRDPGLYTTIDARILPGLLSGPPSRTIRFWSAGCATGEEAYSLAALPAGRKNPPLPDRIRVLGTDVDTAAIATARKGEYPISSLRKIPVDVQRRLFTVLPEDGICRVSEKLRRYTTFRVDSLSRRPPASAFDLILCRNVLIYFDAALQEQIHQQFAQALRPGGFLALGRVERVVGPARKAFETFHARERIYRRI